jgi:hypothetical protein
VRSFPSSGKWGPPTLASTRGPCDVGGCAFRGLTRSATEWSAARRKPVRAAALHLSAAISADVRPVGFRRAAAENLRPEIFDARATLREQRESAVGRRIGKTQPSPFARRPHRTPPPPQPLRPVPVARNRGMSFSHPMLAVARTDSPQPRSPRVSSPSALPSRAAWARRSCARHEAPDVRVAACP